jgi:hypothetical protein
MHGNIVIYLNLIEFSSYYLLPQDEFWYPISDIVFESVDFNKFSQQKLFPFPPLWPYNTKLLA